MVLFLHKNINYGAIMDLLTSICKGDIECLIEDEDIIIMHNIIKKSSININAKIDEYNNTLLHYCIISNKLNIAAFLIKEHKADITIKNNLGMTPNDIFLYLQKINKIDR
jgi:ankyrin repeat protein